MLISEIYCSRQGEGKLTGEPSVFVRTSGCNLRCGFCDTPFASWNPTGTPLSIGEIVDRVAHLAVQAVEPPRQDAKEGAAVDSASPDIARPERATLGGAPVRHVVLTGGEPMLPRQAVELSQGISDLGFHLTIETAGTIYRDLACDLMSISPKFANSTPPMERAGEWAEKHESTRYQPAIVRKLMERYDYQLKFVVDHPDDLDEIDAYLAVVKPTNDARVMLMPQGVDADVLKEKESWLRPLCDQRGFSFCPRMHVQWYGNKRGT